MTAKKPSSLRLKIIEEMTVDYSNALEKNFNLAKQFVRITKEGKVDILHKDKLSGKEQILLYLIGKLYAKEADYTTNDDVGNKELMDELGIPSGSVLPWLLALRNENKIRQIKKGKYTHHAIASNWVAKVLKNVEKKTKKYF